MKIQENRTILLIIAFGIILRLIDIARPFSGLAKWNEGHYSLTALNYFKYGIMTPMNEYGLDLSTTPLLSWAIYASFNIFGVHEWAARLPVLISGIISLYLVYLIALHLYNRDVAVLGTFLAATAPGIVYYSRNVQLESMMTMFLLASMLFLMLFKETYNKKYFWAAVIYLALGILTKYPAAVVYPAMLWIWFRYKGHLKEHADTTRLLILLLFPVLPALLWFYYGFTATPSTVSWYIYKPEEEFWSIKLAGKALYTAILQRIPIDLGKITFYSLVLLTPLLLFEWRKHAPLILFSTSWFAVIILTPNYYIHNYYYHFPALYGLAILFAYCLLNIKKILSGYIKETELRKAGSIVLLLIFLFNVQGYNVFHSYFTDFSTANETEPYYSAKYVSKINTEHAPVLVDYPMTMFYVGADPEYIKVGYKEEKVITLIGEGEYIYVVLYYLGGPDIKKALDDNSYEQIAPRAWKRQT